LAHQQEIHIFLFHLLGTQEEPLSVLPQVYALEVEVFRAGVLLAILAVDLHVLERSLSGSWSHMHSELLELGVSQLHVVDLEVVFAEFEDVSISRFHVFSIAPASVQVVGAFVLALDGEEKDLVLS
jgi:hypothetical protein